MSSRGPSDSQLQRFLDGEDGDILFFDIVGVACQFASQTFQTAPEASQIDWNAFKSQPVEVFTSFLSQFEDEPELSAEDAALKDPE